jgi:4a-hydroxytetrahydrobiopterin dehydratase
MKTQQNKIEYFCETYQWKLKSESLYKRFVLFDFKTAIHYINEIALIAEENNHHPKIINSYSEVEVFWRTNDIKAITEIDFKLAEQCDKIYGKLNFQ